ncbi:MAG: nitrilase-related carbon-nitrogen hydrolase, partial [Dehalococcoidia bacterium]|nr:nitrilase-related carbon-nitrogen hydrolase [Dehalococcoidia bacterium]
MSVVRAAVVQAAPVFLDREATIDKACHLIAEAGRSGAQLVVFPETWVPGYPVWANTTSRWNYPPAKKVYARLYNNAVEIPGPSTQALGEAARQAGAFVAIGVNERTPDTGTLYNTMLFIHRNGTIMGKHQKLMPTFIEKIVHAIGDGSTLQVFPTEY